MNDPLIAKWTDDRLSLSEEEADELSRRLLGDPELARQAKDQIALDERLSRWLSPDRGDFSRQVAQRLVATENGESFSQSTLRAARRPAWRPRLGEAAAAAVLLAVLALVLVVKTSIQTPATPPTFGLRARYYPGRDLRGTPIERIDALFRFDWPSGKGPVPGWGDIYSASWTAKLDVPRSDLYTLRTRNDDGVRIWVDGVLVIDDWHERLVISENRATIRLESGRLHDLRVEYYNGGDRGLLELYWSSPGRPEEIIPPERFRLN